MVRRVFITGFGKFNGVCSNPTEQVIFRLQENLERLSVCCNCSSENIHLEVLSVDVQCVDTFHCMSPAEGDLFVHLGVHGGATSILLERTAYNNMDFRCADECGFQPESTPIVPERPLEETLTSALPLQDLCAQLAATGFNCNVSDDPGRFLCNYVYYRSLEKIPTSVFIHVPPVEVIELDSQVQFVLSFLEIVTSHLNCHDY